MNKPDYHRLDIWWVKLDPAKGNEASTLDTSFKSVKPPNGVSRKTRPCLILQNDIGNQFSDITMIAPFLEPKPYPFVVNVKPSQQNGLDRERGLNLSQMRVAHYSRFINQLGALEESYLPQIENAIAIELNIFGK